MDLVTGIQDMSQVELLDFEIERKVPKEMNILDSHISPYSVEVRHQYYLIQHHLFESTGSNVVA